MELKAQEEWCFMSIRSMLVNPTLRMTALVLIRFNHGAVLSVEPIARAARVLISQTVFHYFLWTNLKYPCKQSLELLPLLPMEASPDKYIRLRVRMRSGTLLEPTLITSGFLIRHIP